VESLDKLLRTAIADRRLVSFALHGLPRVGEPLGWRNAVIGEISDLRILDQRFAGTRPAPTGRHKKWDQLYASVSMRE